MDRSSLPTVAVVLAMALVGLSAAPITTQGGSSRTRTKPPFTTITPLAIYGAG